MVIMKGGVFQHAILNSCGNPVNATPKKPAVSIKKLVRTVGGSYGSNVSVKSGSEVQYQITASNNGQVPAENFTVHDYLPGDIKFTAGTLELNGKVESATNASGFFGKGINLGTVKNGTNEVFTFNATAGTMSDTSTSCKVESLDNTGFVVASTLVTQQSIATVKTTCTPPPTPELSCTGLSVVAGAVDTTNGSQSYTFTASASATNATIKGYTFTVDNKTGGLSASKTLTQSFAPGNHTVSVTVTATANGKTITATGKNCAVNITVKPPVSGTLTCTGLSAVAGTQDQTSGKTPYTFTATAKANGNAKITGYQLVPFANAAPTTMTVSANTQSATGGYTYAPGTYTASVIVTGTDTAANKTVTAPATQVCEVPITVKIPTQPNYTIAKAVSKSANGPFSANVTVPSGTTVYYQITVASTGTAPVANVNVSDSLPKDIAYTAGTLKQDGTALSSSNATSFFGNGIVLASIKNQTSVVFTYSAVAGNTPTDADPSCMAESLTNTGYISKTGLSKQQGSATANTTCKQQVKGSLACVSIAANAGNIDTAGNQSYTFTGNATAASATVKTYTFTVTNTVTGKVVATIPVNSNNTSVTTSAQQLAPGSYAAKVTVDGTDNYGNPITAPANGQCATTFTVKTPECKPGVEMGGSSCFTYTCNNFTLTVDNGTRTATVASFNATSTNTAAVLAHVSIDWGDGATSLTTTGNPVGQAHTFTANSSTVIATAQFTTPDSTTPISSTVCSQPVSFTTTPPTQTPPPVMPNTGAGNTIGIFIGTVVAGTIAARLFMARKLARR
jgi:uncharacterized repeat protein (TIGR01451 family)